MLQLTEDASCLRRQESGLVSAIENVLSQLNTTRSDNRHSCINTKDEQDKLIAKSGESSYFYLKKIKQIWAQSTFIHSGTRVPIPEPDQSNPSVAIKMKEVILDKTASLVCVTR
jgi:hypothetical protein